MMKRIWLVLLCSALLAGVGCDSDDGDDGNGTPTTDTVADATDASGDVAGDVPDGTVTETVGETLGDTATETVGDTATETVGDTATETADDTATETADDTATETSGDIAGDASDPGDTQGDAAETAGDATPTAAGQTVDIKAEQGKFVFQPAEVTIKPGDSVKFTLAPEHDVVEVEKAVYDANQNAPKLPGGFAVGFGEIKTVPFPTAGVHYFVCEPHAAGGMKGKITVQ